MANSSSVAFGQPGWSSRWSCYRGADEQERADELVGRMSGGLRPIIFHSDAIFDWLSRLLLATDGSFDPSAELE